MRNFYLIILLNLFLLGSKVSNAQIFAPTRNWAGLTSYAMMNQQDSIFVFYEENELQLRAQFSDLTESTYQWYKYNSAIAATNNRFEKILNATDDVLTQLDPGGYRVEVYNVPADSVEVYTVWIMIDNVELIDLSINRNTCDYLELYLSTYPNFYDISSQFTYYDLSSPAHHERVALPQNSYFSNHTFQSLNSKLEINPKVMGLPFIRVEFTHDQTGKTHGPLHDASYTFSLISPFGRGDMSVKVEDIPAVATKSGFNLFFNMGDDLLPDWKQQDDEQPAGEALLEIKLQSTAENADSIFWNIINDEYLVKKKKGDSIAWRARGAVDEFSEVLPPKKHFVPGVFGIEHIAKKVSSDVTCLDTVFQHVVVDTSFLNPSSIPNVFSPNYDGVNDFFVLKEAENSIRSIKSFKITILSRWGNKVYEYNGDPKQWEGWNGKINGTGQDAAEGAYFYIIEAVGWDGRRFRDGIYKGFLHLYR